MSKVRNNMDLFTSKKSAALQLSNEEISERYFEFLSKQNKKISLMQYLNSTIYDPYELRKVRRALKLALHRSQFTLNDYKENVIYKRYKIKTEYK